MTLNFAELLILNFFFQFYGLGNCSKRKSLNHSRINISRISLRSHSKFLKADLVKCYNLFKPRANILERN